MPAGLGLLYTTPATPANSPSKAQRQRQQQERRELSPGPSTQRVISQRLQEMQLRLDPKLEALAYARSKAGTSLRPRGRVAKPTRAERARASSADERLYFCPLCVESVSRKATERAFIKYDRGIYVSTRTLLKHWQRKHAAEHGPLRDYGLSAEERAAARRTFHGHRHVRPLQVQIDDDRRLLHAVGDDSLSPQQKSDEAMLDNEKRVAAVFEPTFFSFVNHPLRGLPPQQQQQGERVPPSQSSGSDA